MDKQSLKLMTVLILLLIPQHSVGKQEGKDESWLIWGAKTTAKGLAGVAVGAGAIAAVPVALGAAGFTAAGVAAGSIAAGLQAGIGANVVAGSAFAALQSAGAAGIGAITAGVLGTTGAAAGTIVADKIISSREEKN